MSTAIVVGASSGIGLALCRRLVAADWSVIGLARGAAGFDDARYRHVVADVRAPGFRAQLAACGEADLVVYAAGIGHELDVATIAHDVDVVATNLVGLVITAEVVVPRMIAAKRGHLIGLSSQGDRVLDAFAPSYNASKAGMSAYLEGLALACRPHGVAVTNVRLGFVDTAMSRLAPSRPFLITADRAAAVVERCLVRRPIRRTYPLRMAAVLWLFRWGGRLRILWS